MSNRVFEAYTVVGSILLCILITLISAGVQICR